MCTRFAPILFNIALEYAIRKIPIDKKGKLLVKSIHLEVVAEDFNMFEVKEILSRCRVCINGTWIKGQREKPKLMN